MSQPTETATSTSSHDVSLLTDNDLYLFNEGSHYRIYDKLGAHLLTAGGDGDVLGVWAPNARPVSVIGSFNQWHPKHIHSIQAGKLGIWEGFVPGASKGALYKFHIESHHHDIASIRPDPIGLLQEKPPRTASVVWTLTTPGETVIGWSSEGRGIRSRRRFRSTKFTSARGCGSRKNTTGH